MQDGKPSVQTSTTSPALAWPRCHSTIAQASTADRQHDRHHGMQQPQPLQVLQAAAARGQLAVDRAVEPAVLATDAAEGPDERHVADDVDHLAVDRPRLWRSRDAAAAALPRAGTCTTHDDRGDRGERRRHGHADRGDEGDGRTVSPTQGGSTFQMNMFSTANTALDVAVMRPVSVPGNRWEK